MLELKGVTKVYETNGVKHTVLKRVTLSFRASEFAAILGPSGSGKTTLLNIIGGLDHYTRGDLIVNGKSTKQFRDKDWDAYRNHRVGFVFQSYNLIPHQTILANVRLAMTLSGASKQESILRAKKALREVGLGEHMDKKPAQLSGGQMQRVAIARALVNDPDIILADEPTGALDSETSIQIMDILKEVAKDRLVVMVTHNPELADEYATRIIRLKDGEITADSNPYDAEKETEEESAWLKKKTHTKMSYLTALSLSLKNLLTKKTRTILVALAGSIGIIGIALISAMSTGFQNYINKIEEDTLTSYPLTLLEESADLTEVLLSVTGTAEGTGEKGKVRENQVLTGALGTVAHNDLAGFMDYFNANQDKIGEDVRLVEKEYNIDPLIYTVDATGKLAKLNPSDLFTSLIGETSLLTNYSSLTSVFQQKDLSNLKQDSELVVGRWPEKYDEVVISLADPEVIPDLMTYSLGFHDTSKLNEILTKIMSGEAVETKEEALELTFDDLMGRDLRVIPTAEIYRFNDKYNVYEDMSEDETFMRELYETKGERLKIVGIITPSSDMTAMGNGVFYLPDLITHIIGETEQTEIVKKQLANPDWDVFANKKFGDEGNNFDFEFSDLVSVDNEALQNAFGVTIDQNAIEAKTTEYMGEVSADIEAGTGEVPTVRDDLSGRFEGLAAEVSEQFDQEFKEKFDFSKWFTAEDIFDSEKRQAKIEELQKGIEEFITEFIGTEVDAFMTEQELSDLETFYGLPVEAFREAYAGLLKLYMLDYSTWYVGKVGELVPNMTMPANAEGVEEATSEMALMLSFPSLDAIDGTYPAEEMEKFMGKAEVTGAFDTLSVTVAQVYLKKTILTKIGGLTEYLSTSFADAFHLDQDALIRSFRLNFTEDELMRVVSAMFNKAEVTFASNLSDMGYQEIAEPTRIAFYFSSFEGKTNFMAFLDDYNEQMRAAEQEERVIDYSDTTGTLMSSVKMIVDAVSYVLIAFVSISLVVSSIMIGVITYISVYERTKEIGILRAIGASKHNISSIFNAETFIIGLLAGLFGVTISYLIVPLINLVLHHFTGDIPLSATLPLSTALWLVGLSIILTIIGGLIPAHAASKRDPVEALRTE